jgi:hypothetical protein
MPNTTRDSPASSRHEIWAELRHGSIPW